MTTAYIGLGSNLAEPLEQIEQALETLQQADGIQLTGVSSWYWSEPVGPSDQPEYLNAAAQVDSELAAGDLLMLLQSIEDAQGRVRQQHWGPRTLDLDLLLYGDSKIDSPTLTVPHPRLHERNFVLQPLLDLQADLALPCGTPVASLLQRCPQGGLRRIDGTHR